MGHRINTSKITSACTIPMRTRKMPRRRKRKTNSPKRTTKSKTNRIRRRTAPRNSVWSQARERKQRRQPNWQTASERKREQVALMQSESDFLIDCLHASEIFIVVQTV